MSTTLWASSQILVRTWMTNHLCWKLELGVSRIIRNIYLKNISTWYFRWALNFVKNDRNIASKSSNTSQILETPFLDSDTHKYCFSAEMNISLDLKTGPAFWTTDNGGPTGNVEIIRLGMHLFGKYLQTGIAASPFSLFEYINYLSLLSPFLMSATAKLNISRLLSSTTFFRIWSILFFLFLPNLHHQ